MQFYKNGFRGGNPDIKEAAPNRRNRGIRRYGHSYVPLDEALSRVVVDFSGRPGLIYELDTV